MQVVCLGLLLFSLTWAAPVVQPQTEKTKQDCVEEQRITYKGHHGNLGYYIFKYVYTSSGRKNQTDAQQEEKNKDDIALHHSGKRKRNQEPTPKEYNVQEREKDLFLPGVNKNNQISKSPNPFENRQTIIEDYGISNKENAHRNLQMPMYHESTGNNGSEDGGDAISKLHDQEEYGAALTRNSMRYKMETEAVIELLYEGNKVIKPRNVLSKIPPSANYAKAPSEGKRNHQRDLQVPKRPVKSKSTHHIQHNADYLNQLPTSPKIPSDFEGSGYPDLQEREDNALSPFSGDGQPFKDISGKGETVDSNLEGTDIQTEFSSPGEAETINPEAGSPGHNDIPENGGNTIGGRGEPVQEAITAGVSLVEGSNDIIGSTNFKELPGNEGHRVDAGSQNAHQGKVEFHYPHVPSKEKSKEGSSDVAGSSNYNEIPKHGKGDRGKGTAHSTRNQLTSNEKERLPDKGKSLAQLIPSHGLDSELKNKIGLHSGSNNKRPITTHSGKNNSTWNKGVPQRKGSWGYRKSHANRRFRPPKKHDSSESSDSSSSNESDGD